MRYAKLWLSLILVIAGSFITLGYYASQIAPQTPPIPKKVVTPEGRLLFTGDDILQGQNVWQSIGGQEVGSIWGHGAYRAPDWSADWLHREAVWILEHWAEAEHGASFHELEKGIQAGLIERLQELLRANTYDPQTRNLVLPPLVIQAVEAVGQHYAALFGDNPALDKLRADYGLPAGVIANPEHAAYLNHFFFWTAWVCMTNRPGQTVSYTQNWPPEPLVGNGPTSAALTWSVVSIVLLLAGIGALGLYFVIAQSRERPAAALDTPERDPLFTLRSTPSMRALAKFFWLVAAMILLQAALGLVTAHYAIQGTGFYGFPLARWLPATVARTWHVQLAMFWILTTMMAAALFIAPAVAGREPRLQRLGVNLLFVLLLTVLLGSLGGQWWGVQGRFGLESNYWFGHQGLEYFDLGRVWQFTLLTTLGLWLILLVRGLWPAFGRSAPGRSMLALMLLAAAAIVILYGGGLVWHQATNLARIEFWRWMVIHLWFEGFFEVFATATIAFLFTRMGLLAPFTATSAVLLTTTLFLAGSVLGIFHHLYFTGMPAIVTALGSTFGTLQVIPLALIGFEGYQNLAFGRDRPWVRAYRWPIACFIAVAVWNLAGAGLFGFMLNTPLVLYYMQGLNTTAAHAHAALFGIHGMLGIGLMLFCLKGLSGRRTWDTGALSFAFWAMNIGLALSVLLSGLPLGLLQGWVSARYGFWFARSAEFLQSEPARALTWLRVIGDSIFAAGAVALVLFIAGLKTGWSFSAYRKPDPSESERRVPPVEEQKWD